MKSQYSKSKVLSSLIWKLLERGATQGVQFFVQIVLARLLLPEDYGLITIVVVFINIANVLVQSGFNTALIQKKDANETDFSSVFVASFSLAVIIYIFIYLLSPSISNYYQNPQLTKVFRVLAITLFFGAINSTQIAYIAKQMKFKLLLYSSLIGVTISGVAGIILAHLGFGIWALVAQQLVNQIMITVILWFTLGWRPKIQISFFSIKSLFKFGSKLLISDLLHKIYLEVRALIIGKIYSPAMLGYYSRGEQFPKLIVENINGSIQSVMLPTFSSNQDDIVLIKKMVRRTIVSSSVIIFPAMFGLAAIAKPLISLVLTDKWLEAVPYVQIFSLSYALQPIQITNLEVIKALGHSEIYLKIGVVKKIVGITLLIISVPFGVRAIAVGSLISSFLATIINIYPINKLLKYDYYEQWKDIAPAIVISFLMVACVYPIGLLSIDNWQILLIQILVGISVYLGIAKLFKLDGLFFIMSSLKELISYKIKPD